MPSLWELLTWPARRGWACLTEGGWTRAVCRALMVFALVGAVTLLALGLGLAQIRADKKHWKATQWFLHTVMDHTVRMRTLGKQAPPLDDPALVLRGAGHYATGCAPCHGAPGQERSLIARQMLPTPPPLAEDGTPGKDPAELFWIVKHGLKYTAMPAWPAPQRDDEVWAMVAFLQRLPELTPAGYRRLAYGPAIPSTAGPRGSTLLTSLDAPPDDLLANCARCHGPRGEGRGAGAFPRLAGQREAYLYASLQAYARGERHSGIMQPIANSLTDPQMRALASHYAALGRQGDTPLVGTLPLLPDRLDDPSPDDAGIVSGGHIADMGDAERRIPACNQCHGPDALARNELYPDLAGQYRDYLALQLRLFKAESRGGTRYAHVMHHVAETLSEADIRELAAYYAAMPPRDEAGAPPAP